MPIYEYECENKHRFEKWQSMKDDPIKECPECGTSVRKILHPAGIIFKGSGWYITDSRKSESASTGDSKSSKGESKSESKSEAGESKSEGKSEAKNESSGESKSEGKSDSKGETKSSSGASSSDSKASSAG